MEITETLKIVKQENCSEMVKNLKVEWTRIFNLTWKIGTIVAVYKNGLSKECGNYRA